MSLHSGNKGKRFERRVAKLLTQWSGVELMRTPMSGGWKNEPGDLASIEPFRFVVECKHNEDWELEQLMTMKGLFPGWFAQAIEQAEYKQKQMRKHYWPMLIFTRNRRGVFVAVPQEIYKVGTQGHEFVPRLVVKIINDLFVIGLADDILGSIDNHTYQRGVFDYISVLTYTENIDKQV